MEVLHLTPENFEENVTKTRGKALVDFFAEWCGPCKMLAPVVEGLAAAHPDLRVCKLNVDEAYPIADHFRVKNIPTVILFENGEEKARYCGYCTEKELETALGL